MEKGFQRETLTIQKTIEKNINTKNYNFSYELFKKRGCEAIKAGRYKD